MLKEDSKNDNAVSCVKTLWEEGFFNDTRKLKEVSNRIAERWGNNFYASDVSKSLQKASFLIRSGRRGLFRYKQRISPKIKKIKRVEEELFSSDLVSKLGTPFATEIQDLRLNFGRSGSCTAFLLRKILEKAIFLAFAKKGISAKLEDGSGTGRLIGLEAMVDTAAREKVSGIPFLLPKTANSTKGMKFLGDTSAHNPLINVDMETILPQMPFIVTAYKELAERL